MPEEEIVFLTIEEIDALNAVCLYREHFDKTFLEAVPISPEFARHLKSAHDKLAQKFMELNEARNSQNGE